MLFLTNAKLYSRIDYFFVSGKLFEMVTDSSIGVKALSDHAPVKVTVMLRSSSPSLNRRRLNASLLQDPPHEIALNAILKGM